MKSPALIRFLMRRVLPAMTLAVPAAFALAQSGSPPRTARMDMTEGQVAFSPAGDSEWIDAQPSRPIARGDRLWTDRSARSSLNLGNASVRMDAQTRVDVHALEDKAAQLVVMQGSVNARVRTLAGQENFEIDTPNLAFRASQPGEYRVDVDAPRGTTRVTVLSGSGVAYGENGEPLPITARRQMVFSGRGLNQVSSLKSPPADAFDRWVASQEPRANRTAVAAAQPQAMPQYAGPQQVTPMPKFGEQYIPQPIQQTPQIVQVAPQYVQPQVVTVVPQPYPPQYVYVNGPAYSPIWYPQASINFWAPPYRSHGRWERRDRRDHGRR